jgi:endonuclease/exonuclease/phosphatase (EEP) superfamily protein YafD
MAVKKFEADALEQMFRQHLFSLPLFILQWNSIGPRFRAWSNSITIFSVFGWPVPLLYVLLLCTTVFAQLNRYMSTNLAIESGPLESQIVCAATKTATLLVSLLYFNAPPYPSLRIWGGVVLQLAGSLLYAHLSSVVKP